MNNTIKKIVGCNKISYRKVSTILCNVLKVSKKKLESMSYKQMNEWVSDLGHSSKIYIGK